MSEELNTVPAIEHQLKLAVGLFHHYYRPNQNLIISPFSIVSALLSLHVEHLIHDDYQTELVRRLVCSKTSSQMANAYLRWFREGKAKMLHHNDDLLRMATVMYTTSSATHNSRKQRKLNKLGTILKSNQAALPTLTQINVDLRSARIYSYNEMSFDTELPAPGPVPLTTVLASTIKCHTLWLQSFTAASGHFTNSHGQTFTVPMLRTQGSFRCTTSPLETAVRVNCGPNGSNSSLSVIFIMPKCHTIDRYISSFTSNNLEYLLNRLHKATLTQVTLIIPQFTLSASQQIVHPIETLQLRQLTFSENRLQKRPKVQHLDQGVLLMQRTILQVDHRSVANARPTEAQTSSATFTANRPFLFVLTTKGTDRQILMLGVCEDPSNGEHVWSS